MSILMQYQDVIIISSVSMVFALILPLISKVNRITSKRNSSGSKNSQFITFFEG